MKNSVRKCTAALCLMTLCAALTACGPGGKAKETEESGTGRTEEGSEIWIDGKPGNGEEDSKGQIGTNDSSPQNGTGNSEVQGLSLIHIWPLKITVSRLTMVSRP